MDRGTAVSPDYTSATSAFNDRIDWIQIDLGEDANNPAHQISADERFRIKMAGVRAGVSRDPRDMAKAGSA